jgi:myo-inositol-1(or 4)-monophosphatase
MGTSKDLSHEALLNRYLPLAKNAAKLAAEFLLANRDTAEKDVLSQVGRDIKLRADQQSETIIMDALKAGSDFPILTEETGEHGEISLAKPFWVIDPIDGTMNFSRGSDLCGISIALWYGEQAVLGVVRQLGNEREFSGIPGVGAWLDDAALKVPTAPEPAQAILATGFPLRLSLDEATIGPYMARMRRFKKVRMFGTAAIAAVYVALGFADIYAEDDMMLWDVAGAQAIVNAAGGVAELLPSPVHSWARRARFAQSQELIESYQAP